MAKNIVLNVRIDLGNGRRLLLGVVAGLVAPAALVAGTVTLTHSFSEGTVASAAAVNQNFSDVKSAVDGNAAAIGLTNTRLNGIGLTCQTVTSGATTSTAFDVQCPAGYLATGAGWEPSSGWESRTSNYVNIGTNSTSCHFYVGDLATNWQGICTCCKVGVP